MTVGYAEGNTTVTGFCREQEKISFYASRGTEQDSQLPGSVMDGHEKNSQFLHLIRGHLPLHVVYPAAVRAARTQQIV